MLQGKIRDQGSNFSHETRYARLLATLLFKEVFLLFLLSLLNFTTGMQSKIASSIRVKSRYRIKL